MKGISSLPITKWGEYIQCALVFPVLREICI
jgi:hypothetical protein